MLLCRTARESKVGGSAEPSRRSQGPQEAPRSQVPVQKAAQSQVGSLYIQSLIGPLPTAGLMPRMQQRDLLSSPLDFEVLVLPSPFR